MRAYAFGMSVPTAALEADLAALKHTAERAGTALACLFSSADEYEAELIRERRAQGCYRRPAGTLRRVARAGLTAMLASLLLLF
jgi:hypothetical protein